MLLNRNESSPDRIRRIVLTLIFFDDGTKCIDSIIQFKSLMNMDIVHCRAYFDIGKRKYNTICIASLGMRQVLKSSFWYWPSCLVAQDVCMPIILKISFIVLFLSTLYLSLDKDVNFFVLYGLVHKYQSRCPALYTKIMLFCALSTGQQHLSFYFSFNWERYISNINIYVPGFIKGWTYNGF